MLILDILVLSQILGDLELYLQRIMDGETGFDDFDLLLAETLPKAHQEDVGQFLGPRSFRQSLKFLMADPLLSLAVLVFDEDKHDIDC